MSGIDEQYAIGMTINRSYLRDTTDVLKLWNTVYTYGDMEPIFQFNEHETVYKKDLGPMGSAKKSIIPYKEGTLKRYG